MALIKCPECGKDISDKAEICIGCGYVMNKNNIINVKKKNKKTRNIIIFIIALIVLLGSISAGAIMIYKNNNEKNAAQEKEESNSAVEEVIAEIDGLGEITIDDKENIEKINNLYTALSEEEKALVTNHDVLVTANNKMAMLKLSSENVNKNDKSQKDQNKQKDLDSVYNSINKELWDATEDTEDLLDKLNNTRSN